MDSHKQKTPLKGYFKNRISEAKTKLPSPKGKMELKLKVA